MIECQWFEDEYGSLLIPDPYGDDWLIDTGISQAAVVTLNKWYHEHSSEADEKLPIVPREVLEPLGLITVDDVLKRWDEIDGFYHA